VGVCPVNKKALSLIILALLMGAPFFVSDYWVFLFTEIFITALFATSFNLLLGYTGLVSFGQAAFYAVGAYGTALIIKNVSFSLWAAVAGGVCFAFILSILIGVLCVRLTALYFAMLTMAFSSMIYAIIFKWRSLTGGDDGLPGIARPALEFLGGVNISLNDTKIYYYFVLLLVLLSILALKKIVDSPLGYILRSIRDNSKRAEFVGIPVRKFRLIAFSVAGLFSGLAGSLYALLAGFVSPELAFWSKSGDPVIMSLLGGFHTFWGPTVGAIIYTVLKNFLATKTENWIFYLGVILLVMVLVLPEGVMGGLKKLRQKD
jgi:branched-chain amino acid transport system permease protein